MPFEDAQTRARRSWNAEQKQIELGQRAINRYGCFSCHDIKGFEKAQAIGTDLSEEGSKLVTRLDFAFVSDIPHTSKLAWFRTKLHDPRIFDQGRVLPPLDKLRMPNYDFTEEEVERLVTAIMSFQREIQPPAAMPARSARYDYIGAGRTLVHRRNCVGCHIIEGDGRRLPEARGRSVARAADADARRARACSPTGSTRSSAGRSPSGRGSTSGCRPSASTITT